MKIRIQNLLIILSTSLVFCSSCTSDSKDIVIATKTDSISYSLGVAFGKKIPQNIQDNKIEGIEYAYFVQGIVDCLDSSKNLQLSEDEIERITTEIIQRKKDDRREKFLAENEKNETIGNEFLEKNKTSKDVIEIKPGLQYKILDMGWGRMSPQLTENIYINFKIYNTKYQLLYDSKNKANPTKIYLGSAIQALQEVLPNIKTGGTVRIFTTSKYAYGTTVSEKDLVKPYETLIIDVELVKLILNAERLAEFNRLVELEQQEQIQQK